MTALGVIIALGVVTIFAFSLTASNPAVVGGVAYLLAGACLLIGALAGFLFGIPRANSPGEDDSINDRAAEVPNNDAKRQGRYRPNTNLEQISDWLTKILVGVGLTQIRQLPSALDSAAAYIGTALGTSGGKALSVGILVYFPTAGFLFGFLWTRLFLGAALARADLDAVLAAAAQKQDEQQQNDAAALAIVQQYLAPQAQARISPTAVKESIRKASPPVKVQIFYQAQKLRRENWESNKAVMERTIPIFEALIESDVEQQFHQNFGQLGFALKDKRTADLPKAEEILTKAIEIRGDWRRSGWVIYEANRAECRILRDTNFNQSKPSTQEARTQIVSDLQIALKEPFNRPWLASQPFSKWLSLNQVSIEALMNDE